jgi:hypothetical protein
VGGQKYAARFFADTPGLHIQRFSVDGGIFEYDSSNAVEFDVYDDNLTGI